MSASTDASRAATRAREQGATRFCMGAAWREVPRRRRSSSRSSRWCAGSARWAWRRAARSACSTEEQADALADAGLTAYNHNLDTSPEFYGQIITTRTYDDRLETLARVRAAGITVCCGGIIGMGESARGALSAAAAARRARSASRERADQHAGRAWRARRWRIAPPEDPLEMVRTIATARILMPASFVRLSAGRLSLSDEAQALCFLAGRQLGVPRRRSC